MNAPEGGSMTEEMKKGYVARIASANRSELVVLMYEIMDDCLSEAKSSLSTKADSGEFQKNITRFRGFLNELMGSLDFQYPVSDDLMKLYIWIDGANYENPVTMMNKNFSFKLHADGTGGFIKEGKIPDTPDTDNTLASNIVTTYINAPNKTEIIAV